MKFTRCYVAVAALFISLAASAQVNSVEFGKNRVQHKNFTWRFYQTTNFNTYFNIGGNELAKFVAQVAEEELQQIENFVEYALQRKANIIIYNDYNDYKSTNIGQGIDWQNPGGVTKLVNNKIVVYFDGNHYNLRRQIREGIAKTLVDNLLFGDDVGEFASNQALLDLPQWLIDGYVSYVAEPWSTQLDDQLRDVILSGRYTNFYQFAFEKPRLSGHAFWYYIGERYKKENVTYFLYLARIYKNLNSASQRVTRKKFKDLLAEFMEVMNDRYYKDIRQRRNAPRGNIAVVQDLGKGEDYYRFQVNPNPRNNGYAVVRYKKGKYSVLLTDNAYDEKVMLKYGVRVYEGDIHPNYPILAWDGKGTRLLVVYWEQGKIKMFVYDMIARIKRDGQEIKGFEQILDAGFMLNQNTLLLSAVKNGYTDIFTYNTQSQKIEQITNDVYDDLDPTFVSFPNRSAIIFASNRPSADAPNTDTVIPGKNKFNIFLADILNKSDFKQITQLTKMKFGNARYPMQYNANHFTFVCDENGIQNRWAGFFSTQREGLDTLYYVGDEVLRNPTDKDLDSTLIAWQKQEPDSISYFAMFKDSTYTFPITNYQSSLLETRVAGDKGQVSEVRKEADVKFLYKLKVDSIALRKRHVNARPTEYMRRFMEEARAASGRAITYKLQVTDTSKKVFRSEFNYEQDTATSRQANPATAFTADEKRSVLEKARLYNYKWKFNADYILSGVTNNVLMTRYQPYAGGSGPIQLNSGDDINWSFRVGVSDLMEDIRFIGALRFGTDLTDKDLLLSFQNYRKQFDWGLTYYRSTNTDFNSPIFKDPAYSNRLITSIYQANVSYPFNIIKSLRLTAAIRTDRGITRSFHYGSGTVDTFGLRQPDTLLKFVLARLEYVHDNSINPAQNIWFGLRWKIYFDANMQFGKNAANKGRNTYNLGFDARHYLPIYRNFIWAVRGAGDFSFGNQKIIYYLGGVDGWIDPKFNNALKPAADQTYAFQSLALNMRGFPQNAANGNNAIVINSELRLPVVTTFFNKPINNAFLRNFQLVQFIDLGTAWNGKLSNIERPYSIFRDVDPNSGGLTQNPVQVRKKAGGIGPFVGGYGFGVRSTLLGYFLKVDASWEMDGIFRGKPYWYFALGLDF